MNYYRKHKFLIRCGKHSANDKYVTVMGSRSTYRAIEQWKGRIFFFKMCFQTVYSQLNARLFLKRIRLIGRVGKCLILFNVNNIQEGIGCRTILVITILGRLLTLSICGQNPSFYKNWHLWGLGSRFERSTRAICERSYTTRPQITTIVVLL